MRFSEEFFDSNLNMVSPLQFVKGKDGGTTRISDSEGRIRISMISEDQVVLQMSDNAEGF